MTTGPSRLARLARKREAAIALVLLLTLLGVGLANPAFLHAQSLASMLSGCAPALIVGCGVALVIITGEIDVSVGSLFGLLSVLLGSLASPSRVGLPVPLAITLVLGAGLLVGIVNGLLVGLARVPSIIVTLGMLAIMRGAAELTLGGQWVTDLPPSLRSACTTPFLGLNASVWCAIAVLVASLWFTRRTALGLRIYAVGSNPDAAALAGIREGLIKTAAFAITGLLTGVAAVITAPQLSVVESGLGVGFELLVISAVVVGGVSIRGGVGSVIGVALAAILLGIIRSALVFLKLGPEAEYWERAVQGAFILGAVALDHAATASRHTAHSPARAEFSEPRVPHWCVLLGLLIAGLCASGLAGNGFLAPATQSALLTQAAERALLAVPMTLIMLTGGIDLSIGAIMAIASVTVGIAFERGVSPLGSCSLGVLAGALCGCVNGALVSYARMHPLIVTLATMALFVGIAEGVSSARPVSGFPDSITTLGSETAFGLPLILIPALAAAALGWALLRFTVAGRNIRAIGFNETACRFSAVAVGRLKLWLYTTSGACAGLAAVLLIARRNTAKADAGAGIELEVISAVVLGGIAVSGGRGSLIGVALGVLLLHELRQFIGWGLHPEEYVQIVIGLVLIAATLLGKFAQRPGRAAAHA